MASAASRSDDKKDKTEAVGLPADEAMLLESFFRIEMGLAGKTDARNLSRLAKSSPEKYYSPWALAMLCQLMREAKNDPLASLELLAPRLFVAREDAVAYYNAIRARREAEAKQAKDPKIEIPALPKLEVEQVSFASDWVALEASRSLLALGRYNEAIQILDKLGRDSEDFSRVLAAEAGGDAFACQAQWGRARDFFDYALAFHKQWVKKSKEETPASTDIVRKGGASAYERIERSILARITLKRDEARRLWEISETGPGFLLYKEGEFARKKYKDYRYAIAIYDEIIQHFEKSIWGEAAAAYKGLCLLELAKLSREEVEEVEAKRIANLMETELALYEADKEKAKEEEKSGREAKDKDKDKKNSASKGGSDESAGLTKYTKAELAARVKEAQRQKEQIPWWPKRGGAGAIAEELVALVKGDGSPGTPSDMNVTPPTPTPAESPGEGESAPKETTPPVATADATKPNPSSTTPATASAKNPDPNAETKGGRTAAGAAVAAIPASYQYALFAETRDERLWRRSVAAEKIPIGKDAEKAAFACLQSFIDEQPWGLYRGECLLALGEYALANELDPEKGMAHATALQKWLDEVQQIDAQLAVFDIPEKAKEAIKPPKTTFKQDSWGNYQTVMPLPGDVVNRRSCAWYLGWLRAGCAKQLGFLAFARGDMDLAKNYFLVIAESDPLVQHMQEINGPNMTRRLIHACKTGALRMAQKEDISVFKDSRRAYLISLADFYAETEQPFRAQEIYSRLLSGQDGKLSVDEEAYARFGMAWACWYAGVDTSSRDLEQAAVAYLRPFLTNTQLAKTRMGPRALTCLGNILRYANSDNGEEAIGVYRTAAKMYAGTPGGEKALFGIAWTLWSDANKKAESIRYFQRVRELYPEGSYYDVAGEKIDEWAKLLKGKKEEVSTQEE